jgi:hypothetical protein
MDLEPLSTPHDFDERRINTVTGRSGHQADHFHRVLSLSTVALLRRAGALR